MDGIGDVVAESVVEYFAEESTAQLLTKFKEHDVWPMPVEQVGGPLAGQNFVITGSLQSMSRDQAAEKIRALGGTFQSSLGKDTHFLVVGANVGAAKLAKAAKYGTKQLSEAELLEQL